MKTNPSIIRYQRLNCNDSLLRKRNVFINWMMMFFLDPFLTKFINKLMSNGRKKKSVSIFREVLYILKQKVGFQPFFVLKWVAFRTRQLFKLRRIIFLKRKLTVYKPSWLKAHNQLAYSINHIIKCAHDLKNQRIGYSLAIVLLNCFFFLDPTNVVYDDNHNDTSEVVQNKN